MGSEYSQFVLNRTFVINDTDSVEMYFHIFFQRKRTVASDSLVITLI